MKKKNFLLLIILCMCISNIFSLTAYAKNSEEKEIQFVLEASPERGSENPGQGAREKEVVLVASVKRVDNKIKINCKNVSLYVATNVTFNTMVSGGPKNDGKYWNYSFLPTTIPAIAPLKETIPLSYTMPVLLNNPLFVEVGISAVVNGQVCTAYGLLYW